ncbi:hypothetical protein [Streptococcus dysgalactiae]|uniref:hypothetical protein n=1 Tax=Streptococcus dysgalactiae TaxID=1334 RepID=UPI0005A25689|nr:hypothetical protein [Streptococcus dysgalactiae]OCX07785.1 hypothetical protein GCS_07165 [Streptococcus dysgalactiae subsp. equisimilis AKSDE4288]QJD60982.1 hypothetical protein HG697_04905 [Streptococcus dysgalactiae subsp. equisimilis]QJD62889.1 hypothetical protein HHM65_05020 [Streptococcus dysgalactiae subsp. equisimilis]QJR38353.1 hypothetical protein HHM66_04685 [Streptococcus dysgalactiae subsp. equisimilis]
MKFKISKTLLFTSLAAVALLGVTQQVSATSMELHQGYYWVEEETGEIDGYPWGLRNWDPLNSEENGPYGGALGTGYNKSPGIPPIPYTPWPERNGFQLGPNIPSESDWGHAVQ